MHIFLFLARYTILLVYALDPLLIDPLADSLLSVLTHRVENLTYLEAEDGCLFVVDLAGSENAADSQFHDKETRNLANQSMNIVL